MNQKKIIWANVSVKDVKTTRQFYTGLGIKSHSFSKEPGLASFLFGDDEFVIHFFEQGSRIDEFVTQVSQSGNEIIFTISANTESEVQQFAEKVAKAGGKMLKEVRRDEAGYYGFAFADPDGHKFNVLLMDNM